MRIQPQHRHRYPIRSYIIRRLRIRPMDHTSRRGTNCSIPQTLANNHHHLKNFKHRHLMEPMAIRPVHTNSTKHSHTPALRRKPMDFISPHILKKHQRHNPHRQHLPSPARTPRRHIHNGNSHPEQGIRPQRVADCQLLPPISPRHNTIGYPHSPCQ